MENNMQMIDVLKRLAELDSQNPNVQTKLTECGMTPMPSHGPASINISAGSGDELTGVLRDIVNLAGVQKSHHTPMTLEPAAGVATVVQEPNMKDLIDAMTMKDREVEEDSLNAEQEEQRTWDSSPDEKIGADGVSTLGDINQGDHRERQKGLPLANPMESVDLLAQQLFADYQKFVAEGKKSAKSDYLDLDNDGNKTEPMKKAAKEKKKIGEGQMKQMLHTDAERMSLNAFLDKHCHRDEDRKEMTDFWQNANGDDSEAG